MAERFLRIRPYAPGDLPVLQALREAAPIFRGLREAVGPDIAPVALADAEAEQAALLEEACRPGSVPSSVQRIVVCLLGEVIVGFACFKADEATRIGEIGLNAVHPDPAGRGIGTRLYADVLARLKELGMTVATVSTGGDADHAPARRAYEKAGFGRAIPSVSLYRLL